MSFIVVLPDYDKYISHFHMYFENTISSQINEYPYVNPRLLSFTLDKNHNHPPNREKSMHVKQNDEDINYDHSCLSRLLVQA